MHTKSHMIKESYICCYCNINLYETPSGNMIKFTKGLLNDIS